MAIRVAKDRVVTLAYRLTDSDGRLIEDRTPENPFEYIQGLGHVLPAIERVLEGKTAGFQWEIQVPPRDAYGAYKSSLVAEVPASHFPHASDVAVGMKFNTVGPDGGAITVRVIEVKEDMITIDGNHPLAGIELVFALRVLGVREATEDEIECGAVQSQSKRSGSGGLH